MTTTVEILRQYNRWRRGDDTMPQPDPEQIGKAIDSACDEIERLKDNVALLRTQRDYLMSSVRRTLEENGHLADGDNCTLLVLKRAVKTLEEVGAGDHDYYPAVVCSSCGAKYGRRRCGVATWHAGKCGICGIDADVTDPRDFGHLHSDWRDRHKKESA